MHAVERKAGGGGGEGLALERQRFISAKGTEDKEEGQGGHAPLAAGLNHVVIDLVGKHHDGEGDCVGRKGGWTKYKEPWGARGSMRCSAVG